MKFRTFIVLAVAIAIALAGWGITEIVDTQHAQGRQQTTLTHVVAQQQLDHEDAVLKNAEARRSDCENGNKLREGLRANVIDGQKNVPLLLKAVPGLNTKEIIAANNASVKRQIALFAPLNCTAYSLAALPSSERVKVSLEQQQAELKNEEAAIVKLVIAQQKAQHKSAVSRITTVSSRCELTKIILNSATKNRPQVAKSLAGCEAQLQIVKQEALATTQK